ncbi:polyphosphate kinase 2 [Thalassobacter stenotrophicus]|uniref:ADP/GDP-polyphosphate phosphotransferase n=2 Tax=Thalassobacter stenotrophicus TaxID=266809 RepID=A0A0P1EXK7_9RHOB|nr:polyphosphate kinase 2 [Thalassobacter stenotrophicus]CUH59527.1 polyphosphate kinase 2 [Thalassobacter stenotrophicus]SHI81484.1 polyphosphate kinase 2, PA0141 family [Thalassobacter stenotrophicus DSM 16310]
MTDPATLPFDGAISAFFEKNAPKHVREAIRNAGRKDILAADWPYKSRLNRAGYDAQMQHLQIQLVRAQAAIKAEGKRVVVIFEGRDAAGKGGTIKRVRQNLNPRVVRTVALSKPTEAEAGQWYFQRYIQHLPTAGEMVLFDRSWYNRAVVEHVFGFCTAEQRAHFFAQVQGFEDTLVEDGVTVVKLWLNVSRPEQLRRFLARESDPLKQWKLSRIDVEGLHRWDAYTDAISETFTRTHSASSPWTVIRSDDKRRARLNALRAILLQLEYPGKDLLPLDPHIAGGPEVWHPGG